MEPNIEEWANEFITAYYSSVVYSKKDVSKFYDPDNAIIYRESLPEKTGVKLSEANNILCPYIGKGDKLFVTQFNTVPTKKGFNLSVFGRIIVNEKTNHFAQFFTIGFFENRAAIISDSLLSINVDENIQQELVEIPRPPRNKQNASRQSSKNDIPQQTQQTQKKDNENNNNSNNNNINNNSSNDKNGNNAQPTQSKNQRPLEPKSSNSKPKNSKFFFSPE